jgi:hypothetical protein
VILQIRGFTMIISDIGPVLIGRRGPRPSRRGGTRARAAGYPHAYAPRLLSASIGLLNLIGLVPRPRQVRRVGARSAARLPLPFAKAWVDH